MNSIALSGETLPVPVAPTAVPPLSEADRAALRRAVDVLERPGLAARLSA
ncbi:EcsC family protein, partial [Methylorubrum suomiense]